MSKVYITQVPHRKDKDTGAAVPTVNIGPASEHGDVITMLPWTTSYFATADIIKQMALHLDNYSYDDGDVLIALGDPLVIGCACAYLARKFGRFTMGKWDKHLNRYLKVVVRMEGLVE